MKSILPAFLVLAHWLGWGCEMQAAERQKPKSGDDTQANTTTTTMRIAAQVVAVDAPEGARPERRVGKFTIPPATLGVDLKYEFNDPNVAISSSKLGGGNLFSVAENRYLRELESVPIRALPPGDYIFEIGGTPGSNGELTVAVVPGTPRTKDTSTIVQPPPDADTNPPGKDDDEQVAETWKAIERSWSGQYTIQKITGNTAGMGTVPGTRAFQLKFQRDKTSVFAASGVVWMPPGWFGNASGGSVSAGRVVKFYVVSKPFENGILSMFFEGRYDPDSGSLRGTLVGYRPKGGESEAVYEGTWYLNPR